MSFFDSQDGGWKSRKLIFGFIVVVLAFGGWLLTGAFPVLQATYLSMLGALTGTYTLFIGANIGNKHVVANNIVKAKTSDPKVP